MDFRFQGMSERELSNPSPGELNLRCGLSALRRYAVAVGCVLIGFLLRYSLTPLVGHRMPFALFISAAMVAAWYGGAGPGLVALVAGWVVGDYFFLPPLKTLGFRTYSHEEWVLLASYVMNVGIGLMLIEDLHRTRRRAQAAAEQEQDHRQRLELEMQARRQSEEARRQSDETLAEFLEEAPVGIHWIGPDGDIQGANHEDLKMLGYPRQDFIGRNFGEFFVHPIVFREMMEQLKRGARLTNYQAQLRGKDGCIREVSIDANVRWEESRFVHARCFLRDLAGRRVAERRLRIQYAVSRILAEAPSLDGATPEIMRLICQSARWEVGAIWSVDAVAQELRCAEIWHEPSLPLQAFRAESEGRHFARGVGLPGRVWASGEPIWLADLALATGFTRAEVILAHGLHAAFAFPIKLADETLGVFEFFSREIRQPEEEFLQMMTALGHQIGQFIERRRAEETLRENEARFHQQAVELETLYGTAPFGFCLVDRQLRYLRINDSLAEMNGVPISKTLGRTLHEVIPLLADKVAPIFRQVFESGQPILGQELSVATAGDPNVLRNWWVSHYPLKDATGAVVSVAGIVQDVTAHKQAAQALAGRDREFKALVENSPDLIARLDRNLRYLYINPAVERVYNLKPSLFLGKTQADIGVSEGLQQFFDGKGQAAINTRQEQTFEFTVTTPAGPPHHYHCRLVPELGPDGSVESVLGISRDISGTKHAEASLRQAQAELELRVTQRTTELRAANEELQRQIAERHRLEKELIEITEGERIRIGQNLHDDLGQQLTGIALLTRSLEDRLVKKRLREATDAHKIQLLVNESISHTRELARNLTSVRLGGDDLPGALETLSIQTRRLFNISCRFKSAGTIPKLEEPVARQFYNIAQEAVTNAIKHGKARHISIRLACSPEELVLVIRNNGQPFAPEARQGQSEGMGLRIMSYRASVVGAQLKVGSNRKRGAIVVCALPINHQF